MTTQDKWELNCWKHKDGFLVYDIFGNDGGLLIAEDVPEEYAQLITATPKLLEACKNLVRGQLQHPTFEGYVEHAIWVAEQAIADAESRG